MIQYTYEQFTIAINSVEEGKLLSLDSGCFVYIVHRQLTAFIYELVLPTVSQPLNGHQSEYDKVIEQKQPRRRGWQSQWYFDGTQIVK
jgi:hypothetical protein